jgi:hypothetical protein
MTGKRVLMVEGPDDEHVVKNLCSARTLDKIDHVHPYGGKDPLIEGIPARLKESDLVALGILLDADTDLHARWEAVAHRLRQAGYGHLPAAPTREGLVIEAPENTLLPRVGIWLMPDNQVPGILEDFLRFLVPAGDPLFAHVEQSVDRIPDGQRRFGDLKKPKAKIHTWLAWQDEPGKPLGQAIRARYLDPDLPAAKVFAHWLDRTFLAP